MGSDYLVLTKEEHTKLEQALKLFEEVIDKNNWKRNHYHLKQGKYKLAFKTNAYSDHKQYTAYKISQLY
jgi:hypothetical protein